jgi:hypothetical protein
MEAVLDSVENMMVTDLFIALSHLANQISHFFVLSQCLTWIVPCVLVEDIDCKQIEARGLPLTFCCVELNSALPGSARLLQYHHNKHE